jgi:hypothetical protein
MQDLYAEAERLDRSAKGILHRTLFRPFTMLAMEPILVLATIYLSLVYGVLYACTCFVPFQTLLFHVVLICFYV